MCMPAPALPMLRYKHPATGDTYLAWCWAGVFPPETPGHLQDAVLVAAQQPDTVIRCDGRMLQPPSAHVRVGL